MRAGTDMRPKLADAGAEAELQSRDEDGAASEVMRARLLFLQRRRKETEAGPGALASLWPCNIITPKGRLFCNGHNTEGSHITSRCSCRKAQQTLAVKFSQSRVA